MKPGRNDPCSCGSGKKFKHCCQGENVIAKLRSSAPPEAELARLGNLFNAGGHLADVERQARLLVEQYPSCATAWKLLGASLHIQGKDGLPALRKAVDLCPTDAAALSNLGNALKDLKKFDAAITFYRRALKFRPDLPGIHHNLGLALADIDQFDSAIVSYRQALALKPDYAEAHIDLGNALKDLGQLKSALSSYRRALEIKPDLDMAYNNLLFVLNYTADYTPSYYLEKARQYGQMVTRKARYRFTTWQCTSQPERLRVGIVSGDLRNHPVGYFLEGMVAQLDPTRIEFIAYSTNVKEDALTSRIRPHFTAWKSLVSLSDEAAAHLIHSDRVHILLDLSGHSRHNRLPVFAWKPAKIQISWLGYFATTGVVEIDYFLADRVGVPEEERMQFTETIYYLPDTRLCFTPPSSSLSVTPLPALSRGHITFGCFQNIFKISDNVLAAWGEIFTALPNAKLRMQCAQFEQQAQVRQMTKRLQRYGIEPERVKISGAVPREVYLSAYAEVDLILDTFPFPGGTTTCEALWMGVPTLTLAGNTLLARQGASLLTAAGLEEWVASSKEEYVAKVVSFASNAHKLADLRESLRSKVLNSPLFDASRFARQFESALWEIWELHSHRQQPLP